MSTYFGNVQFIPGVGHVEGAHDAPNNALGDESAIMMISGMGEGPVAHQQGSYVAEPSIVEKIQAKLQEKYTVFGIELPLWLWLLIAAGVVSAGWWFYKRQKKLS